MPDILYGGVYREPSNARVTGMGSVDGPGVGASDGWQIAARLPASELPNVASMRLGLFVKGTIGNLSVLGSLPSRGVVQVCLGTDGGLKSQGHLTNLSVRLEMQAQNSATHGIQFSFLMAQQASPLISDPEFGGTWNPTGGSEIVLWARFFWNNDQQLYSVAFDVSGVEWLWLDMDTVGADAVAHTFTPASPIKMGPSSSAIDLDDTAPSIGADGEQWAHFARIIYQPNAAGADAPWFEIGKTDQATLAGFTPEVGSNSNWGQNRAMLNASGPRNVRQQQGCFWTGARGPGIYRMGLRGADRFVGATPLQTDFIGWTTLSLKLDNLLDVLTRSDALLLDNGVPLGSKPDWHQVYSAVERPIGAVSSLSSIFAHAVVDLTLGSYGIAISDSAVGSVHWPQSYVWADPAKFEGMSSMSWTQRGYTPTMGAVQIRRHVVGGGTLNQYENVRDSHMFSAYLLRDPSNIPSTSPSPVNPTVLQLGREGLSVSNLLDLPTAPDAVQLQETKAAEMARIDGKTRYARTWPLFVKPRRSWQLTWSDLNSNHAKTLEQFLRSNSSFRIPSPHGVSVAKVPVVQRGDIQVEDGGNGRRTLSVQIVELIFVV